MPPAQNHQLIHETLFIDGNFLTRDMLYTSTNAGSTCEYEYSGALLKTSSADADSQLRALSLWKKEAWNNANVPLCPSNSPPISEGYYFESFKGFAHLTFR